MRQVLILCVSVQQGVLQQLPPMLSNITSVYGELEATGADDPATDRWGLLHPVRQVQHVAEPAFALGGLALVCPKRTVDCMTYTVPSNKIESQFGAVSQVEATICVVLIGNLHHPKLHPESPPVR